MGLKRRGPDVTITAKNRRPQAEFGRIGMAGEAMVSDNALLVADELMNICSEAPAAGGQFGDRAGHHKAQAPSIVRSKVSAI